MKISQLIESGSMHTVSIDTQYDYDFPFLEDSMKEKAWELLEKSKIPEFLDIIENIKYSLGYSQGDGVAFHGGETEWEFLREETADVNYLARRFVIVKNSYANHYSHSKTFYIECEFEGEETEEDIDAGEKRSEELYDELKDICHELEKYGHDTMEEELKYNNSQKIIGKFLNENSIENIDEYCIDFDNGNGEVMIGECEGMKVYVNDFEVISQKRVTESVYYTV